MDWSLILNVILGVAAACFAIRWAALKVVVKEISEAIEDDDITPEEADDILKAIRILLRGG